MEVDSAICQRTGHGASLLNIGSWFRVLSMEAERRQIAPTTGEAIAKQRRLREVLTE